MRGRGKGCASFGYKDVALLDIFIGGGKPSKPYISKPTAKSIRKRAYKALVDEYIRMEHVARETAEIEVDCIICCLFIEKKGEGIYFELN